jgi:putative sugar O-methyltransferase
MMGDFIPKRILEVGVGFGALCKIFSSLYDFEEYILIDLPEVIGLCKKYLNKFPSISNKLTFISTEELKSIDKISDIDLFISDSAIAECSLETQLMYADKIIKYSKYGYLVYNTQHLQESQNNFKKLMERLSLLFDTEYEYYNGVPFFIQMKKKNIHN